jgi:hypothetical protein
MSLPAIASACRAAAPWLAASLLLASPPALRAAAPPTASPSTAAPSTDVPPAAIVSPSPVPGAEAGQPLPPLSDSEFEAELAAADLAGLDQLCQRSFDEGLPGRLRRLRERLLAIHPAPQPLPVLLANADVLLTCRAPAAALEVLDRFGPGPGAERVQWLLLQWRAARAALDHRRASLALERLSAADPAALQRLSLPLRRREDGTSVTRPATEVLADHLEGRGLRRAAAELLLASRQSGLPGAERLQRAMGLFDGLSTEERDAVLEEALETAAAAGAWGLVNEILDGQADLDPPSARAIERRLRLSGRLDDAYGEWRLRRRDPAAMNRTRELERQLRSPRGADGHNPEIAPEAGVALPPAPSFESPSP